MKTSERNTQSLTAKQIRERSSLILGKNLIKHNEPPKKDYAAHHIIPLADGRTKWARDVRELFDFFFPREEYEHKPLEEWPINQHFNGVWMRNRNFHQLTEKEIPHSITHDQDYYRELYRRLKPATTKEEFLNELAKIKEDIQQNRFWDHNPEKLKEIEAYRQKKIEEHDILEKYREELEDAIPPDLQKALTDNWSTSEWTQAMEKTEQDFYTLLQEYEKAKEGNPNLLDFEPNPGSDSNVSIARSPENRMEDYSSVIATIKDTLLSKGWLPVEKPINLNNINKTTRRRLRRTLRRPSKKPSNWNPIRIKSTRDRE